MCQVAVSHRGVKPASSLIRRTEKEKKSMCCGGFPLWAHGELKRNASDKDVCSCKIHQRVDVFLLRSVTQFRRMKGGENTLESEKADVSFSFQVTEHLRFVSSPPPPSKLVEVCLFLSSKPYGTLPGWATLNGCAPTVNTPQAKASASIDGQPWH